jgi:putative DNA primase/helicase
MFLDAFKTDLEALGLVPPPLPDATYSRPPEPEGTVYFKAAATMLGIEALPQPLLKAAATLERAAADTDRLDEILRRRLPCLAVNRSCALDRALELWFSVRDELKAFENGTEVGRESPRAGEATKNGTISIETTQSRNGAPDTKSDEEAFLRLAQLTPAAYDRVRRAEATKLGLRLETLDTEVEQRRATIKEDADGNGIDLPVIEPWPEPVEAAQVLGEVSSRFSLYVVLPPGAADAIALWTAHTHVFEAFFQTPRLNLYSPERGCGKTTTMDVLASMVPRPIRTENLTAPTLFRAVDQHKATLLLDEVDAYLNQAEELRGLLNAGHKRGACAYRCDADGKVRSFKAFAPAVLAGIGHLPGTLHDRSIPIPLVKALPGEITARFEEHRADVERTLARKLARWARDNTEALKSCDPALPSTAFNRLADNWRPLFAIAQIAGGDWPARAAASFNALATKVDVDAQGLGVRLLQDIRSVFTESGVDRILSKHLVSALCSMADSPWPEAHRGGRPITETWLGHRLRRFGIVSKAMRVGEQMGKGFAREDFTEAFARFLGNKPSC